MTSRNDFEARKVFILRHGERVDFVFGPWTTQCFDETGKYSRNDLNMPETIPARALGPAGYNEDTPLTNIGIFQATTLGEALKNTKTDIDQAYCSPSFRCIQTCDALLKGCGKKDEVKIKVEPGLFEWLAFYRNGLPDWMTTQELIAAGYNIDADYKPFLSKSEVMDQKESYEQFYMRNSSAAKKAVDAHPSGNVLLVGHSLTLDICARGLSGKEIRPFKELIEVGSPQKIPYCAFIQLSHNEDKWEITKLPFPSFSHSSNERFDYKILLK